MHTYYSLCYSLQATVRVVSLETASRPYDCTLCLAAFDVALVCPRAFRKHSQDKPFACSNCPAAFTRTDQLRMHQEKQCTVAAGSNATEKDSSFDAVPHAHHKAAADPQSSQCIEENSSARSDVQGDFYECHVCKQRFQYRSLLLRHIPYHSFQYSCGFCKKAYEERVGLLDHFQIMHEGRTRMLCRYCGKKFEDLQDFERHIRAHKGGTVVACTVCKKKFSDSKLMLKHLKTFHARSLTALACNVCGKKFQQAQHLSAHKKIAHGSSKAIVTKFLSCRFCSKVFHKRQGLSSHYRLCHGMSLSEALSTIGSKGASAPTIKSKQKAPVRDVQSKLKVSSVSKSHAQIKEKAVAAENKSYKCHKCGRSYNNGKHLEFHCRNIHGVEVLRRESTSPVCKICGKMVQTQQGLKTHYKLAHKQEMPVLKVASKTEDLHKCIRCGKCFAYRSYLFRHIKMAHGNTKKKSFRVKQGSHHLGKPWLCRVCGKPFGTRKSMRLHMKRFHPQSYQDERLGTRKCGCGKIFSNKTGLLEHKKNCGIRQQATKGPPKEGSRSGQFSCTLCEKTFIWMNSVVRHLRIRHKLTKSDIGTTMTIVKAQYRKEFGSAENKSLHLCKICKEGFLGRRSYKRHLCRAHGNRTGFFQCRKRFCRKTFTKDENFIQHIKMAHPGMLPYRCVVCKSQFSCASNLFSHSCFPAENSEVSSNSQQEEFVQEEATSSQPLEHECRYRCMTCGMGFHIAREWTRHMQEHHDDTRADTAHYEKVIDTTEKIRLNIFDVISGNAFTCHLCEKTFTDEEALDRHSCPKPSKPKKASKLFKTKSKVSMTREKVHVKCPVCLKLFSPLSIKRHMRSIHSLPMKVCKKCNLVFTDLQRFQRHYHESHKEPDTTIETEEDVGNASAVAEDPKDLSLTFFACQSCDGLFNNADALQLHYCSAEQNTEQPAMDDQLTAQDVPPDLLETSLSKIVDPALPSENASVLDQVGQATTSDACDDENIDGKAQRHIKIWAFEDIRIDDASSTEHVLADSHVYLSEIDQIKKEVDNSVLDKQTQKEGSHSMQEHADSELDNIDQTGDGQVESSDVYEVPAAGGGGTHLTKDSGKHQKGMLVGTVSGTMGLFTTDSTDENQTRNVMADSVEDRNERRLQDTSENSVEDGQEKRNEHKPKERSAKSSEGDGRITGEYQRMADCVLDRSRVDLQTDPTEHALEKNEISNNENKPGDPVDGQNVNPVAIIPTSRPDEVHVVDTADEPDGHEAENLRIVQKDDTYSRNSGMTENVHDDLADAGLSNLLDSEQENVAQNDCENLAQDDNEEDAAQEDQTEESQEEGPKAQTGSTLEDYADDSHEDQTDRAQELDEFVEDHSEHNSAREDLEDDVREHLEGKEKATGQHRDTMGREVRIGLNDDTEQDADEDQIILGLNDDTEQDADEDHIILSLSDDKGQDADEDQMYLLTHS